MSLDLPQSTLAQTSHTKRRDHSVGSNLIALMALRESFDPKKGDSRSDGPTLWNTASDAFLLVFQRFPIHRSRIRNKIVGFLQALTRGRAARRQRASEKDSSEHRQMHHPLADE